MEPILYISAAVIILISILLFTFLKKFSSEAENAEQVEDDGGVAHGGGPRVPPGQARRRPRANRLDNARRQRANDSDDENMDEDDPVDFGDEKIGAKKLKKLQEKEEKRRQREAEVQDREERKQREAKLDEQRKKHDAVEEAEEAVREEEERKRKEEEERKEHEEYLLMKATFTVDEEGADTVENEDSDSLLQEFINFIQDSKVVMLEDLAAQFKLRTQDAIDRVSTLVKEGRLTGVLDDRGKFIHITTEEYAAVARFIRQRGRVSISELADSSNTLISLSPKHTLQSHIADTPTETPS